MPPVQGPEPIRMSRQFLGILEAPIVRRRGIGRILGGALVSRRRGDCRNPYLPVAGIKGRLGLGLTAGNLMSFRPLAHCGVTLGSRIRHTKPHSFPLWIGWWLRR